MDSNLATTVSSGLSAHILGFGCYFSHSNIIDSSKEVSIGWCGERTDNSGQCRPLLFRSSLTHSPSCDLRSTLGDVFGSVRPSSVTRLSCSHVLVCLLRLCTLSIIDGSLKAHQHRSQIHNSLKARQHRPLCQRHSQANHLHLASLAN